MIRVQKLASFAGKGGVRINRVYELLEIVGYVCHFTTYE